MKRIVALALVACLRLFPASADTDAIPTTLAVPGPGSLNYLPVELIPRLGADRAEGLNLRLRFFSGGPLAIRDMLAGHSDFAVMGAPALADFAAQGAPVVSIAAVTRLPAFVLMVRKDLEGRVRRVADLKGRTIGINTSNAASRSTSQQMVEHLLRRAGVDPTREVNFLAAGQSLAEHKAAFDSGAVDALMGDEPFASALKASGRVYYLVDLHAPETAQAAVGGRFLYAQLATRRELLAREPNKAARMARALRRSLQWLARATPEQIVARIEPPDETSRKAWLDLLRRHKALFSPDGAFVQAEIDRAAAFHRANAPANGGQAHYDLSAMIEPRFVGLRGR